jgi:hypothetical protein
MLKKKKKKKQKIWRVGTTSFSLVRTDSSTKLNTIPNSLTRTCLVFVRVIKSIVVLQFWNKERV